MKSLKEMQEAIKKLEDSARKIVETRGYTQEVARIRMLEEMIREQLRNENHRSTTRSNR